MASPAHHAAPPEFAGLDPELVEELPTFEVFFKTFGFKRMLGRVWGLLVLAGQPLSSKEIAQELSISQGATSTALTELAEWGAVQSTFDPGRRCQMHSPVGNTLSIVATVLRRREQVVFGQFKAGSERILNLVRRRYGRRDPRVLTLRSIISSCEIAESLMQLVFSAVGSALGDSESLLSRAVSRALRVGVAVPAKLFAQPERGDLDDLPYDDPEDDDPEEDDAEDGAEEDGAEEDVAEVASLDEAPEDDDPSGKEGLRRHA